MVLLLGLLLVTMTSKGQKNRIERPFSQGRIILTMMADNAVRIQYAEREMTQLPELIYAPQCTHVGQKNWKKCPICTCKYKVKESGATTIVFTPKAEVTIDAAQQSVVVRNRKGVVIFRADEHQLRASSVAGEPVYEATLRFNSPADEYLFGLGQFQDGYTNVRGLSRRLTQVNTQISIPLILSNKGYGLLWNNYGMTEFNPIGQSVVLQRQDGAGQQEVVNVTSTQGGRSEVRVRNVFEADIDVPAAGCYSILLDVGQTMARRHDLEIDGKKVIDMHNLWLPPTASVLVDLSQGRHKLTAELERGDKPVVYYAPVQDQTVFRSPVANCVDYTLFVGSADEAIATFRHLSGDVPLMPRWAMGYIHCRERFHSQDEIIQTAQRFRKEHLPLDVIVQDWQWWGKYGWNAMQFDEDHYPAPDQLVQQLHAMNVRLMLSVWSKIDKNSQLGKEMLQKGYYIPGTDWIDFFNPDAANAYWQNFSQRLLKPYAIDAWWQDATEPENDDLVGRRIGGGKYPGELFRNVYPLMVNKTVYEGLRQDDPQRRPMILTRCGFPGIQRYGSAMWSGDVGNDFETLRRQIVAGLGMQAAGQPWWTYDAGGFFRPGDQYTNQAYIQRMLRWIETSTFLPLMRVHGYVSNTEPWNFGPEAQQVITRCLQLRYRLLPYIYSNAAAVSMQGGTLMRPFVFDFPDDALALQQSCEYMFGKTLLVSPVTEADVHQWQTYLPQNAGGWYDFATNRHFDGGQTVTTAVDIAAIPVFARGGSILPLGPVVESSAEAVAHTVLAGSADQPIEIRIYPGADADFTLYDDEGTNNDYEQGAFRTIPMHWDNASRTFTIGKARGAYEGMSREIHFTVSLPASTPQSVVYQGKPVKMKY